MKVVLSGNEAFARGAYESGVTVISSYPGTPSTEITENAAKYGKMYVEWATNEKVALEVVLGASLAGARAMTAMKHVGLNVAADPLMTSSYTGVTGGVVIVVADDPNMYSSQNEQDSRHYARFSKLPMLEPADSQEALTFIKEAFEISEKYKCPVLVRSTTRVSHSLSVAVTGERQERELPLYQKDSAKWVMTPVNARQRHLIVEERLKDLQQEASRMAVETLQESRIGIITSGAVYQYVREAMPEASVLKLGMIWPLPYDKIKDFASKVDKLYVVEELDPFMETELRAAGISLQSLDRPHVGELSVEEVNRLFNKTVTYPQPLKGLSLRLPNMCAGCSHRGIFYAISRLRLNVTGDIGCYTLGYMPPLSALDSCVCMGASVSMAHGFDRASGGGNAQKSVAVIGDSTFMHTGINGLMNTVFNKGYSTVVILDNRITGMTGHQPNPGTGYNLQGTEVPPLDLETLCRALGVNYIVKVDPFNVDECMEALKTETARREPSVIITSRPCIFVDKKEVQAPYEISEANCSGCKACLRLGCPAISWDSQRRQAVIDDAQCTGCGLCPKVCRFNAIIQRSI